MKMRVEDFIYWVEDHKKLPSYDTKNKTEKRMYSFWKNSDELKEIENKYIDILSWDDVPQKYRRYIEVFFEHKREKSVFKRLLTWLDNNNGKKPHSYNKMVNKKRLRTDELPIDKREERALYARWNACSDREYIEKYKGLDINLVPIIYRDYIARLREYGYGVEKEPVYPKLLEWLKKYNKEPRASITTENHGMSKKQIDEEIALRKDWDKSEEKELLIKYIGIDIEDVPEEHRDMIKTLRYYGLEHLQIDAYEGILKWFKTHTVLPRGEISENKKAKSRANLTAEERDEINLRNAWNKSEIKEKLEEYIGVSPDEIPEEFREKIIELRKLGLGIPKLKVTNLLEDYIKWCVEYGKRPRTAINTGHNKFKIREKMTDLEAYEVSLAQRFQRSKIRDVLNEYYGKDISCVPEEFREDIARLREVR